MTGMFEAPPAPQRGEEGSEVQAGVAQSGPIGPVGSGRLRLDLGQVVFIVLVLVVSLWVTWWYRGPLREMERLASDRAQCAELEEVLPALYWDEAEAMCRLVSEVAYGRD